MKSADILEALLGWLLQTAGEGDRTEINEDTVIGQISEMRLVDRASAIEIWQEISEELRSKRIVRGGRAFYWNVFRNAVQVTRLATVGEMLSTAEIYRSTTEPELRRAIRSLSGVQFEQFLTALLSALPEFRNIVMTQASHDSGIDLKGYYYPPEEQLRSRLIGQAKQVGNPISASVARDFIGALDTSGERRLYGLLVSTSGFTEPAVKAISESRFHIIRWDMTDLLKQSRGLATKTIDISFEVLDQTFWDEICGRT